MTPKDLPRTATFCYKNYRLFWIAAAALALVLDVASANASLIINVAYNNGCTVAEACTPIPAAAVTDFNNLVAIYENTFSNNITVNLNVNWAATGLGASGTTEYYVGYAAWTAALKQDATAHPGNAYLAAALATLPANDPLGDGTVLVNAADAKALGLIPANFASTDSTLLLSNTANFEYNGVAAPNAYDFMDVAAHELNEALGIGSALTGLANLGSLPTCSRKGSTGTCFAAEDYFRYSSSGQRDITTNPAAVVYFSYDAGAIDVAQFNQDNNAGGNTAADRNDWIYGNYGCPVAAPGPYVQDAIGCPDQTVPVGQAASAESTVLETLGYDPVSDTPEPSSILLFALGLGLIAVARRAAGKVI